MSIRKFFTHFDHETDADKNELSNALEETLIYLTDMNEDTEGPSPDRTRI